MDFWLVFSAEASHSTKSLILAVKRGRLGDLFVEMDLFRIIEVVGMEQSRQVDNSEEKAAHLTVMGYLIKHVLHGLLSLNYFYVKSLRVFRKYFQILDRNIKVFRIYDYRN